MIIINTHEAKTRLSALLAAVEEQGEWVRICRNGRPIAELRPVSATKDPLCKNPRLAGVVFMEDPTAPLSPEDWPAYAAQLPPIHADPCDRFIIATAALHKLRILTCDEKIRAYPEARVEW